MQLHTFQICYLQHRNVNIVKCMRETSLIVCSVKTQKVQQRSRHTMLLWPDSMLKHWHQFMFCFYDKYYLEMDFVSGWHQIGMSALTYRMHWDRFLPTFADRMMNQLWLLFHQIGSFTHHRSSRWSSLYDTGFPWPGRLGWLHTHPSHIWRRYLLRDTWSVRWCYASWAKYLVCSSRIRSSYESPWNHLNHFVFLRFEHC